MKIETVLRVCVCLCSILLLFLLGVIAQEFQNIAHPDIPIKYLPSISRVVYVYFGLNTGNFLLSLTPFMILLFGLAVFGQRLPGPPMTFWYVFVLIWLLALIYIASFVFALVVQYHILLATLGQGPLPKIIGSINIILVLALAVLYLGSWLKKSRSQRHGTSDI